MIPFGLSPEQFRERYRRLALQRRRVAGQQVLGAHHSTPTVNCMSVQYGAW